MKYYVIINGNSSLDIQGLAIESLPNISKPLIRTTREEIDGRDGDIITKLGYSAYDKTLNIGLWGNYDINEVIAFFNEDGVITFSNEPDKYYKFHILNRIDFVNQLEKFKKASITIHCQPFKYKEQEAKVIEEEAHTTSGTSFNLSDTLEAPLEIDLKGNTSQTGTPTPSSPIAVNVVSGDNDIVVDTGKNKLNLYDKETTTYNGVSLTIKDGTITLNGTASASTTILGVGIFNHKASQNYSWTYIYKSGTCTDYGAGVYFDTTPTGNTNTGGGAGFRNGINRTANINDLGTKPYYLYMQINNGTVFTNYKLQLQIVEGTTADYDFEAYNGTTYPINLPVENLFDKDNANILDSAFINPSTRRIDSAPNFKTLYISCKSNTTYTIQKILSARFTICTTNEIPTYLTQIYSVQEQPTATNITITTNSTAKYLCVFYYHPTLDTLTPQQILDSIQIEYGTNANAYTPYGTTPIELCKIGTYQDYFYKDSGKWYLHKEIGKKIWDNTQYWFNYANPDGMMRYYTPDGDFPAKANLGYCTHFVLGNYDDRSKAGQLNKFFIGNNVFQIVSDILNTNDFKDMLEEKKPVVYYALSSATNTEITYTPLINQLNTLEEAQSYEGTTNINQVNNDLPFIIDLTYYTGDTSITITNDGNIYSKPLLELKGTGNINIYLNGIQVFVVSLNNEIIYIDTDKMEAYYQGTLKNRQVVGDYNNFKLQSGNNTIQVDGGYVEYLKITNYSRWV